MSGPINQRTAGLWFRHRLPNLAGGLNQGQHPSLLLETETPDCLNVDFDGISAKSSRGNKKFNNQTAVRPGLLVGRKVPGSLLPVLPSKSVPLMSSVYIPYNELQDIGGVLASLPTGSAAPADKNWATQRGRNFELKVSFRLPEDTKLMSAVTLGSRTTPNAAWTTLLQGEEVDEFIAIVQKGGDRLTPMSWALGLVNVGNLLDMDVGGGINGLGLSNQLYKNRRSNYALCFMWLDAPQFGVDRPVRARYSLSNTQVYNNEAAQVASSFGRYPTFAYRAFIAPWFAEPGKNHHVSISLTLDSGTSGTGVQPTPSWNGDGLIRVRCCDDYESIQTFEYDQTKPGQSTLIRYKGPSDGLEYFAKYGIRWWGKDAMFVGLNQRFAPWTNAGFIPFGIDAVPAELGGFDMMDMSAHGQTSTLYGEITSPEAAPSGVNTVAAGAGYQLEIERNALDATGTIFEVNQRGLVQSTAHAGVTWGDENGVWIGIGVQGRSPWGPYGYPWAGLGGTTAAPSGFNSEALRSYRLVLGCSTASPSFSSNNAAGQLISIGTYTLGAPPYGGTQQQYITSEFKGFSGAPTFAIASSDASVTLRAFRWVQRPLIVSDLRIYSGAQEPDAYDLQHDFESDPSGLIVGLWRCDDGGDDVVRESILQNDGYMMPLGMAKTRTGGVWLSGEGEALTLDMRDNPDLLKQVHAAINDGFNGFAINMRVRLGEAYYGMQQKRELWTRLYNVATAFSYQHRMPPVIAAWSAAKPDRDISSVASSFPQTASGTFSPPQPLLELSHASELESSMLTGAITAASMPMGFSLKTVSSYDEIDYLAKVPGTGATGVHTWWNTGGGAVGPWTNRWDDSASWVGRPITIQIGFEPTATSGTYRIYIAVNDGSEKCYWSEQSIDPREIERSVITIGGSWSPRLREKYYSASTPVWQAQGRSIWEACCRMIVDSVTVYTSRPPGALPATSGSAAATNGGKTTHPDAINGDPELSKIQSSPSGGTVRVTNGSWSILPGGASFTAFADSAERSIIRIGEDKVELPDEDDLPKLVPATYYSGAYASGSLSLNRPYYGPSQGGVKIVAHKAIASSTFDDDMTDQEFSVSSGGGYNISSVLQTASVSTAQMTDPMFGSLVDLGLGWRVRIYSNIGTGSSYLWKPRSVRGASLGRGNAVRGLYGFDGKLFAGSRGSIFEVDDRWRKDDGKVALEFREQSDRVVCPYSNIGDIPQPSHGSDPSYIRVWCFDAYVWLDSILGTRTVAWVGNDSMVDTVSGSVEGSRWCASIVNGRPRFSIHSSDTVSGVLRPYRRFNADSSGTITTGKWVHIRWVVRGNANGELQVPSCWIDGIPTTVGVDAVADGLSGTAPWVSGSGAEFVASAEVIALGSQRASEAAGTQPTFSGTANRVNNPMQLNLISGWVHGLGGKLSKVACFTAVSGDKLYDDGVPFDPSSPPMPGQAEVIALYSQTPIGEVMMWESQASGNVEATIYSHPFISLSHELGSDDEPFSFAAAERRLYVANGGRIGVIDV